LGGAQLTRGLRAIKKRRALAPGVFVLDVFALLPR